MVDVITAPQPVAESNLPERCCGRCEFARFEIAAPQLRDCAFDPPRIFMANGGPRGPMFITEFPKVKLTMWCGKFQKKRGGLG